MPNLNRVFLMGNLTRDPELRYTPNNTAVTNIGIAVNRIWRSQDGQKQEETSFIDCEAWGRTAEVINQYLRKGRPLFVEGRLKLDQWQDKDGGNRSKLKVVVERFEFIDSRGGQGDTEGSGGGDSYDSRQSEEAASARASKPAPAAAPAGGGGGGGDPHQPIDEGDIPF